MYSRRGFLKGLGTGALVIAVTVSPHLNSGARAGELPQVSKTWYLHDDTGERPLGGVYSGSTGRGACATAESSTHPGPGRLSAYFGALYVADHDRNRLRTGRFEAENSPYRPLSRDTTLNRMVRWASTESFSPGYRFEGRINVQGILQRPPGSPSGLTFHPVHIDNCNNYFLRFWQAASPRRVTFSREVNDAEPQPYIYDRESLPNEPVLGRWYEFKVDVLPGSRFRFFWDGDLVFDIIDPNGQYFAGGPVGMRMDYFDVLLEDTRVVEILH